MYKILAIGNSFSEDAMAYLHQIAESAGIESKVVNLYIGGCPLERHAQNIESDAEAYTYTLNGVNIKQVKMGDTLREDDWDFVTIQQASPLSGMSESYFPYAQKIADYVRELAPSAKLIVHQTWAYEANATSRLTKYNYSQKTMYDALVSAYAGLASKLGIGTIRSGELIQKLRSDPIFDIANGGRPITRDGGHINIPYGRYALGLLWFKKLMGGDVFRTSFIPNGADAYIINRIKKYVDEFEISYKPREYAEWCNFWFEKGNEFDSPRVMLIGDSITVGYRSIVQNLLANSGILVDMCAGSRCAGDIALDAEIEYALGAANGYDYSVVHFNNGLHGGCNDTLIPLEDYKVGYRRALEKIMKLQPNAKLVLATSTTMTFANGKSSVDSELNGFVYERNEFVRSLAAEYSLALDDLCEVARSGGYAQPDGVHFAEEGKNALAAAVAEVVDRLAK